MTLADIVRARASSPDRSPSARRACSASLVSSTARTAWRRRRRQIANYNATSNTVAARPDRVAGGGSAAVSFRVTIN
ncbi:hypothetical protein AB5I41_25875 [Sphingomonas sp. MMS24-JH45]